MKVVGLTGGIGSGKSLVAKVFEAFGFPIYSADAAGKRLLNTNAQVKSSVIAVFGENAYVNGAANRAFLASQVFSDKAKLEKLNTIIHPAVALDFNEWKLKIEKQGHEVCIKEAAILFESGSYKDCDLTIAVTAPTNLRVDRVVARDGVTKYDVEERMKNQWPQDKLMNMCDAVIDNSGEKAVIPQVATLINTHFKTDKN